jgi:hypothetical protein
MRLVPAVLLFACVSVAAAEDTLPIATPLPGSPTAISAEDPELTVALADLAAASVALGLPDPTGCELVRGMIQLERKAKDEPAQGGTTEAADGIHLRRPDGSLLINGFRQAADGVTVTAADLKPIAGVKRPVMPEPASFESSEQKWLESVLNPADYDGIPGAIADRKAFAGTQLGMMVLDRPFPFLLQLARMHHPNASLVARLSAYCAMPLGWETRAVPLRLIGSFDSRGWMNPHAADPKDDPAKRPRMPTRAVAIRLTMARTLINLAVSRYHSDFYQPIDRARVLAAAEKLSGGVPGFHDRIMLLQATIAVPAKAPERADLATQLVSWDPERTGAFAPSAAPIPGTDDPGALVALLADLRPTRWVDRTWPRTLGDNALRALCYLIGCDPRLAVGRDPAAPWTSEERSATASALAAWWKPLAGKTVHDIKLELIGLQNPFQVCALLQAAKQAPDQGMAVLDRLASVWSKPPKNLEAQDLQTILDAAGNHVGLRAAVMAWPVEGKLRQTLAIMHALQGDCSYAGKVIDAALDEPKAGEKAIPAGMRNSDDLCLIRFFGTEAQIRRLLQAMAKPIADETTGMHWIDMVQAMGNGDGLFKQDDTGKKIIRRGTVVTLACMATLLQDERPLPAGLKACIERFGLFNHSEATPGKQAEDLRICDFIGAAMENLVVSYWPILAVQQPPIGQRTTRWSLDLGCDKAARDQRLSEFRTLLAEKLPPLLKEMKLDLPVYGPAAAGGDRTNGQR